MRACVTGYGVVDCLGTDPSSNFERLVDEVDYITTLGPEVYQDISHMAAINRHNAITRAASVVEPVSINVPSNHLSKTMLYGMYATERAMAMANVPDTKNVAVILSSVTGGNELRWEMGKCTSSSKRYPLKKSLNVLMDALCSAVSERYNFTGVNVSIYAACATGIMSIDYGMKLLDEYDYVIVGGSDHGANPVDISFFGSLQALSDTSAPFDDSRTGFVIGSGAGVLILESEEKAKARGATIYAYLYPAGNASDGNDRTAPSGVGACTAMEKAIANAGPGKIDFVNAHGTSTPVGDPVEYQSIMDVLGDVPIYSNKGKIGHTMAAAGVIETIYSIESMKYGIVPHTFNHRTSSFDINNNIIKAPYKYNSNRLVRTLNNSFGFGGKCSSMVIEYEC
jgi:3-oxoacyl-[acyl-carrier-protein] synthase II